MRIIDADALKEALTNTQTRIKYKGVFTVDDVREFINNAPTVQPLIKPIAEIKVEARLQGKWIKIFENPYTNGYVCPFCGHKIQVTEQFLPEVTECESCGAELKGSAE